MHVQIVYKIFSNEYINNSPSLIPAKFLLKAVYDILPQIVFFLKCNIAVHTFLCSKYSLTIEEIYLENTELCL